MYAFLQFEETNWPARNVRLEVIVSYGICRVIVYFITFVTIVYWGLSGDDAIIQKRYLRSDTSE